jgi:hypothetical protein
MRAWSGMRLQVCHARACNGFQSARAATLSGSVNSVRSVGGCRSGPVARDCTCDQVCLLLTAVRLNLLASYRLGRVSLMAGPTAPLPFQPSPLSSSKAKQLG